MSTRAVPFGKYHLLERINVGGMAEVYKAKMIGVEGFEKLLAIKRILPAIAADKDFIAMFIDEAKIQVQLNHANIAQTFELGRISDTYFIAMEYVSGRDLRAVFERLRRRGEVVPVELGCYVISRIAEGLDYAHRKKDASGNDLGIIHRDISPQNILVSYEGEVKLIDFGIAKAANKMMKTQAGILKGKFGYMSPEQVRGLPLDWRSDIFAAGIVLYELLTGERLFTGESDYSVLEKVRTAAVPRPSTVRQTLQPALERIVLKALAKDPDDRYPHASELVADLQRYLLAQEKLFTREDLAAFMKTTFAEEFEREKRSLTEDFESEDGTPTDPPAPGSTPSAPMIIRPPGTPGRPRLEGAAARPTAIPPPSDAFTVTSFPARDQPSALKAPRLGKAAQAAETDKVSVALDEEDTTTTTDPAGDPDDEPTQMVADPSRPPTRSAIADQPTRVARPSGLTPLPAPAPASRDAVTAIVRDRFTRPPPPPVASRPPPPHASTPPRIAPLPAITDHLPEPARRPPPPVSDEPEAGFPRPRGGAPMARLERVSAGKAKAGQRSLAWDDEDTEDTDGDDNELTVQSEGHRQSPLSSSRSKSKPSAGTEDEDTESTAATPAGQAYVPRRKSQWAIVPIAGGIAACVGFLTLRAVQHRWPFGPATASEDQEAQSLAASVVPAVPLASLEVDTDPPDAVLYLDQRLVKPGGDTPFRSEHIDARMPHVLVARKDGFRDASTAVVVAVGERKDIHLSLVPLHPPLVVRTTPEGATVKVDDLEMGKTPQFIGSLGPGRHALSVHLACYEAVERTIVLSGHPLTLEIPLHPAAGACLPAQSAQRFATLRIVTNVPAHVFIDGTDAGWTPLNGVQVPPGKNHLRLVANDGHSKDLDIEVAPGAEVTKTIVLR